MKNLLLILALFTAREASAQTTSSPAPISVLSDASATTAKIATDAVTSTKILNGSVTTSKLSTDIQNAITSGNVADNGVTTTKLATDSVTGAKILNGTVTTNKLSSTGYPGVKACKTNQLTVQPSTVTQIFFSTATAGGGSADGYNRGGVYDQAASSGTFTANGAGLYFINCCVRIVTQPTAPGAIQLTLRATHNGTIINRHDIPITTSANESGCVTTVSNLSASETRVCEIRHDAVDTMVINGDGNCYDTWMNFQKIGN